ncbi:MAG: DMT family transporter [Pseudomonadota bacterium]|nr:DMT family transporter [Pseudomonadota bacterium]
MPDWIWIPLVLAAAAAQTVRNAAQRNLTATAGTLPATFVRFFYGLPFAAAGFLLVAMVSSGAPPSTSARFLAWIALGSIAQLVATAFLLAAMEQRSFIVAVAYSKTELVQIVLYSIVLLGEEVSVATVVAIGLATAGVLLLSIKPAGDRTRTATSWVSPAAFLGLASGACFALSAVGYRAATLALPGASPPLAGTYAVLWGQAMQSLLLGGYLLLRDRVGLRQVLVQWRLSLLAGGMGSLASMGWLTAFAMRSAADVRTVGLVEVLYGYAISRRFFREAVSARELSAIALIAAGIVLVSAMQR